MLGKITLTKNNGGGGGGSNLNVFAQNTEPATTEGVWIDTSGTGSLPNYNTFNYEGIECNDYKYGDYLRFMPMKDLNTTQPHPSCLYFDPLESILFGSGEHSFHAYSVIDGSITNLADIPAAVGGVTAFCLVGELIYFISGTSLCVYDYINNEWTSLANRPVSFGGGGANGLIQVGDELYTFGSQQSSAGVCAYKYNITRDEWVSLAVPPYGVTNGQIMVKNSTDIFWSRGAALYKYNIANDSYTTLASCPNTLANCRICHLIGNYIYACCGSNSYKYDITNDIWSEINKFYTSSITQSQGVSCVNPYTSKLYTFYDNHVYEYDAGDDRWDVVLDLPIPYFRGMSAKTHAISLYTSGDILLVDNGAVCKLTPLHTKQNYIYLKTENTGMDAKISNELTAKISGSLICTSTGLYKYPTYIGADDSWHLLPS